MAPTVTIPKGGSAARGIGEKFSASPATGSTHLTIPLPLSPGRPGFTQDLSLTYDSGQGHGVFGLGWDLALPGISRTTDRRVRRYDEDDRFLLSGTVHLVPMFDATGKPDEHPRTAGGFRYPVLRYRPRTEVLFTRIERWACSEHVFTWLICASYDNKGNAGEYEYVAENSDGVDLTAAHEQHRGPGCFANRYLKAMHHGNRYSQFVHETLAPDRWRVTLVLDYGEYRGDNSAPDDSGERDRRQDPFSRCRFGFEARTYRLCCRPLMFHHFPRAAVGANCPVGSMAFAYRHDGSATTADRPGQPLGSVFESATVYGHRGGPAGGYLSRSLSSLELGYMEAVQSDQVHTFDAASLENPAGMNSWTVMVIRPKAAWLPRTAPDTTSLRSMRQDTVRSRRCRPVPRFRWQILGPG